MANCLVRYIFTTNEVQDGHKFLQGAGAKILKYGGSVSLRRTMIRLNSRTARPVI